jgi:hypothetical protein
MDLRDVLQNKRSRKYRADLLRYGPGRAAARRGEPGDHEQNSDGDDDTVQPAVIRGLSSAFFRLTPLSCSFIVLNLFSLCFVRLLFLFFYRGFGASLALFGVIVLYQRFRIDIILC